MASNKKSVFIVSDGTGETLEKLVRAALVQYPDVPTNIVRYKSIRTEDQAEAIVEEARDQQAMVAFTVVSQEIRKKLFAETAKQKVMAIDVLGPILGVCDGYLGKASTEEPGLLHKVDEQYFKRIEALEFAVKHDDGNYIENLHAADIVLVGVSRTSKTPLSIYLAHKGYRVANIPLVKGIEPPATLYKLNPKKVVALIIDPSSLISIRRERMLRMGRDPSGDYCSPNSVVEEVEWSRTLFDSNRKWPLFDVTNKALEETAADIERTLFGHKS